MYYLSHLYRAIHMYNLLEMHRYCTGTYVALYVQGRTGGEGGGE